ncbi:zinc ribbon domain-containing protein [Alloprevotella tannerae]|uniref:Zinc ribbon domain protein n=1 Tax=Alloprevotella tannerae ATCC 51259 TaxID=626522 RepID=C9LD32_9BACT|nr:C4-type zinc ribbon domain-containing protein [Alloprevotella tannerae]EEX72961.1 putative zinc ribbon domain protein [Alloprevotella tannerae ATCC 51259]
MAKKDVAEMSVEQKLKTLYQLQTTLSEVDKIKTLRGELPLEVQDLEDEIAGFTTRLNKYEEEVASREADIEMKQHKIAEAKSLMDRYQEQQKDVKNNREYDMLSKEIEFQTLEIELQNKKIGEARVGIEKRLQEIEECKAVLDDRQQALAEKKAELDDIVAETKAQEEKLREKGKTLEVQIEPRLLTAFKRIRKNSRNGLGIVYVQRDACGGCFNKIPPQRQLDIRMRKKIIVCEYCGRIMIDPELAGVKPAETQEEKPKRRRKTTTTRKTKTEE